MASVRHLLVGGRLLFLVALLGLGGPRAQAVDESTAARMRKDITFLASDQCEGRGVATQGINLAADYIAAEFKKAGLRPGGQGDSYFQPFTMPGGTLDAPPRLLLRGPLGQVIELRPGTDYEALGMASSGMVASAPVVLAGYGVTGPKEAGYDDYKDLDVTGKVVLLLRDTPRTDNKFAPITGDRRKMATLTEKLQNAERHKAAGVIFVNDRSLTADGDDLMNFSYTAPGQTAAKLPAVHVRRALADRMLQSSLGGTLAEREQDIDRDLKPHSAELPGWTASLELNIGRTLHVKNVIGFLEGSGPLAKETVVIGAHYDHLGYGGPGSLANLKKPAIHHGADDNGSGSTSIMEIARHFAQMPRREGRRLVFIAFSGEESGLLGSVYYCKDPVFALGDTVAMVNLDMVGRLRADKTTKKDKLEVWGTGTAKTFNGLIDRLNEKYDFQLKKVEGGFGPSDHASFYAKQVPVFFFFTSDHEDYHRPSDTSDKINIPGMEKVVDLTEDLIGELATVPERPKYVKLTGGSPTPGNVPRIGIRPSYGDDGEGVLLDGVVDGGPAAKAGLKEGDRIVAIGGKPVKNLEAYMTLIRTTKKGDAVELGVLRDGKKLTISVTPE
jgi:Zn-dependent M28 family amino/carboxypeptidase